MTSLRHNTDRANADRRPADGGDPRLDGYLDAARECILDVGWTRTTLTEIARRAGVSRMTMYRAWPDMKSVLGDLMTREWLTVAAAVAPPTTPSPAAIAESAGATVRALRDNDLFVRIVELDPELLLPYLLSRRGRSQQALAEALATVIEHGQSTGLVRSGEPVAMARALLLLGHGFAFSAMTMVDDEASLATLDAEFTTAVRRTLEPS